MKIILIVFMYSVLLQSDEPLLKLPVILNSRSTPAENST